MSASSFIARRYFTSGSGRYLSTFLTVVAVMGVAVGVFAMTVVLSVMHGFTGELEKRLIGFNSHIVVSGGDLSHVSAFLNGRVDHVIKIIEGEGIIQVAAGGPDASQGIKIRGIDDADIDKINGIEWYGAEKCIVGSELAFQLGIHPIYNDTIKLIAPLAAIGPTGEFMPHEVTCKIGGIFKSGYFEYDSKIVMIPSADAARLLGMQAETGLHVWLKGLGDVQKLATELRGKFRDHKVLTWTETNRKLFSALRLERIAMALLLGLIVAVASISVTSVIFLIVFSKKMDISVLVSMGSSRTTIRLLFLKLGMWFGIIGTVFGLAAGLFAAFYMMNYKVMLPSSYYLDYLPVEVEWPFVVVVAFVGVLLAMLASYIPARQASRIDPSEGLRYE